MLAAIGADGQGESMFGKPLWAMVEVSPSGQVDVAGDKAGSMKRSSPMIASTSLGFCWEAAEVTRRLSIGWEMLQLSC